jgi:Flp pilus assembly protein TadD
MRIFPFRPALLLLLALCVPLRPLPCPAKSDDIPESVREAAEEAAREAEKQEKRKDGKAPRPIPPDVQVLLTKGNRFYALGEYDGARVQYLEALKRDPKSPEAHYGLGMTYLAMGDVQSAIVAWRRSGEVDTVTANLFDEFGKFRAARDAVQSQLKATRTSQSDLLARRREPVNEKYVKRGVRGLFDTSNRAMLGKLEVPDGAGEGEDADVAAAYAVPGGDRLAHRGAPVSEEDLAQSNLPPAAADVPLSVRDVPDAAPPEAAAPLPPLSPQEAQDPKARGIHYARAGNPAAASTAFEEALAKNPNDAEALEYLAATHLAAGDLDKAESEYKRLAAVRPGDSPPLTNLGGLYMNQGRFDDAQRVLEEALRRNPRDSRAVNNLAGVYYKTGRVDQAIARLKLALQIDPNDLNARNNLAGIYYRQEQFGPAIDELQKILAVDPGFGVAAANLEEAIKRKRDFEEAKKLRKMRARQIVVSTQAEAESLRGRIKTPEEFVRVAREKSLDPSAAEGGDMGFFSPGEIDETAEATIKRLSPGEISAVVKTPAGYAIFQRLN